MRKVILRSVIAGAVTLSMLTMTACGDSSDNYEASYSTDDSDEYSDYSSSDSSSSYEDDSDYSSGSSYNASSNYSNDSSNSYSSNDTNSDEGHAYSKDDPFYSANDHDGDGKLTDEEWQDAMNDAITYYYYEMQKNN